MRPPKNPREMIVLLTWVYFGLLIFEGALRKWLLTPLATPLLVARDPIVVLIYLFAIRGRFFPYNGFVAATVIMAFFALVFSLFSPISNLLITAYGIRINFFHIPLIFILGRVLNHQDVRKICTCILWLSLPMACLLVFQFFSPQTHIINRQVGGAAAIFGALDKFRPSGTFSFITGVAAFFPLVTAVAIGFLLAPRNRHLILCFASLLAVVIAFFFSISRLNALSCLIVVAVACFVIARLKNASRFLIRSVFVGTLIMIAVSSLPFFEEGVRTFQARWEQSTSEQEGGVKEAVVDRFFTNTFVYTYLSLFKTPITGRGVGVGSNVGAKMLTGQVGFNFGESEWQKVIIELGPILGLGFIAFRIAIVYHLLKHSLRSLRHNHGLALLIFSACALLVLNGQWGPPTIQGFAMFGAGLCLAAAKPLPKRTSAQVKRSISQIRS